MQKLMMKRINPTRQQYRIIGFNNKMALKNYFLSIYNVPRTYTIILKEGEHFKKKFFDVNFVCLSDKQIEQITQICKEV